MGTRLTLVVYRSFSANLWKWGYKGGYWELRLWQMSWAVTFCCIIITPRTIFLSFSPQCHFTRYNQVISRGSEQAARWSVRWITGILESTPVNPDTFRPWSSSQKLYKATQRGTLHGTSQAGWRVEGWHLQDMRPNILCIAYMYDKGTREFCCVDENGNRIFQGLHRFRNSCPWRFPPWFKIQKLEKRRTFVVYLRKKRRRNKEELFEGSKPEQSVTKPLLNSTGNNWTYPNRSSFHNR